MSSKLDHYEEIDLSVQSVRQKTYYVVNDFLNTLARLKIWDMDIEQYMEWRAAINRLTKLSIKHHEKMYNASKIQGQENTEA